MVAAFCSGVNRGIVRGQVGEIHFFAIVIANSVMESSSAAIMPSNPL
jgi:hypothetical protein